MHENFTDNFFMPAHVTETCKSARDNFRLSTLQARESQKREGLTAFDNNKRDEYVEYLEEKLERVTSSLLELNCFSDRLGKLENLYDKQNVERFSQATPKQVTPSSQERCDMVILKNRLILLEEKVNRSTRETSASLEPFQNLIARMDNLEQTCLRLADDSMATVQSMNEQLSSIKPEFDGNLSALESKMSTKISDSIDQVTQVLRKLIAFQKILYDRTGATRANTPVINPKAAAIQELYREIEYMQHGKMN